MRKSLLILLACLVSGVSMAQSFNIVEKIAFNESGYLRCIPPDVSYGGHSAFYIQNYEHIGGDSFSILDDNFEVKKSFIALDLFKIEPYINGVYEDNAYITISQTLFNNDEKYEYVSAKIENEKIVGFSIVSEDGTILRDVLFDYAADYCECSVYLFSDKCYLAFHNENHNREESTLVYEIERDVPPSASVNPCDVNGDGNVTAADVTKVYDFLLND